MITNFTKGIATVLGLIILIAIYATATQWAWNHSITPIFHIRELGWLEALALNLLFQIWHFKY